MTIVDQNWTPDVNLAGEVRTLFDSAVASYRANHHLISEHANHEESIRVGGYANRTLLELVQNAADAMAGAPEDNGGSTGRVEIVLDRDRRTLYCANSGRPFSKSGLVSIAHAHLSGKRGDEIGRFGLGFKSVLAVSDSPQIFSRSVSFEFNSAESRAALSDVPCMARRYPVLRTATVVDPHAAFDNDPILADLGVWASTVIKLPGATNLDRLRAEIKDFPSEFLLFVGAVRQLRLRVLGEGRFETSHVSHNFGGGHFKIERSDGTGDEWFVQDRMHRPTAEARREVGEAVSRAEVKVTVAMPLRQAKCRTGRLWSYFPLQDETSASALFNAPWSVNDDRTTLLPNKYNHEILETLSGMFVHMLPRVSSNADPAAHLDYMPARGRETLSFGDELLCAYVPKASADVELVPDANGTMRLAADLRPLDFFSTVDDSRIHEAWIKSPHTGDDVPHWRCYSTSQRIARLRQLFAAEVVHDLTAEDGGLKKADRDLKKTLEGIPKRGLRSWLQEWAGGTDLASAAAAVRFAIEHQQKLSEAAQARIVPTTGGPRALRERHFIFLRQEEDVQIEDAVFVLPRFLALPGIEDLLRTNNFRDLDPLAVLNARVARLSNSSNDEELEKLWDAVMGVSPAHALKALAGNKQHVKVPTQDGGWAPPYQVFDLDATLADQFAKLTLDPDRCLPKVAHQLGVIREPVKDFLVEDEALFQKYRTSVLNTVNEARGPGERPVENVDVYPGKGPGPFSVLFMLRDVSATPQVRARWTVKLLEMDYADWTCDDTDTGNTYAIQSPVKWAVERAGLLDSTRGIRAPYEVVAPSLLRYTDFLPLFRGPGRIAETLGLPDVLEDVPVALIEEALAAELFPQRIDDTVLVDFVLAASRILASQGRPARIPARVGRVVESCSPSSVYIATTDEQAGFLASRQRPCLRATDEQVGDLVEVVGCRRFEESFAFSMFIEGQQEGEQVLDVFTGLRNTLGMDKVHNATITKAIHVAKRTTTEDGVEDQSLEWHLVEGRDLVVRSDVDDHRLLEIVNKAFSLGLTNAQLEGVRQEGLDHRLESLRHQAAAAANDAARLELYLGSDDMRDALPKGLWQALESQGHVDDETSVAELLLTVYGKGSIRHVKDLFLQEGFTDVPTSWTGGASTISWLRKMGFGAEYAGLPTRPQEHEFVVPGAVKLTELHQFQKRISRQMKDVLTLREANGRHLKAMVELPTGAGKTRVATQTVLQLFIDGQLRGPVLWIAQSQELCEQAVQTWSTVWRGLGDERPLTIGRLWENHVVNEPDTAFSIIVATDAKLDSILENPEYEWLRTPSAVIVDEGHRAGGSERYTRILSLLGVAGRGWERPLVGLSATPFKGKSLSATAALASRFGNKKLDAFDTDTAYTQLADLGVLARVEHEVLEGVDVALSAQEIADAKSHRKISPGVLDRVGQNQRRMTILVDHIRNLDPTWPVLVFTPSVLSAQVLAATLRFHEIDAHAVSGQTGRQERREVIDRFKNGKIRVLANCDLLIQGFDAPGVRALYIARPTFSPNAYIQMAGRGLRGPANGGKEKCLIVDMADNFGDVNDLLGYREYEDLWQEQRV